MTAHPLAHLYDDLEFDPDLAVGVTLEPETATVWVMNSDLAGQPGDTMTIDTTTCATFDALVEIIVERIGVRPGAMVFAVPGIVDDWTHAIPGFWRWGAVDAFRAGGAMGTKVRLVSLVTARAIGARKVDIELHPATLGGRFDPGGQRLYVAWSNDVTSALEIQVDEGAKYHVPSDSGRITWTPQTRLERRYLKYLGLLYRSDHITVNQAVGGKEGFRNAANFLLSQRRWPANWFRRSYRPNSEVEARLADGRDLGPVIDAAAAKGDEFALNVIQLVAPIFGRYLRTLALVGRATDGIVLVGGVPAGQYFDQLYIGGGLLHGLVGGVDSNDLAEIAVQYADGATNAVLAMRGAVIQALRLAAEE